MQAGAVTSGAELLQPAGRGWLCQALAGRTVGVPGKAACPGGVELNAQEAPEATGADGWLHLAVLIRLRVGAQQRAGGGAWASVAL